MTLESFFSRKKESELESQFDQLRQLQDRRDLLQQHWSELFEQVQDLDFKYPSNTQFDENNRFRGDRGFYNQEDLAQYQDLNQGMKSVEEERNEVDKEILKRRFELGAMYLKQILQQESIPWRLAHTHDPDPKNPLDILSTKEWQARVGDAQAKAYMAGERKTFFMLFPSVPTLDAGTRNLPFDEITFRFDYGPRRAKSSEDSLKPGLTLTKRFDPLNESRDRVSMHVPLNTNAYAMPEIDPKQLEDAKNDMLKLARQLDVSLL